MKTNNTPSNLKGMAKHTYNRVMSAMAEDSDPAMLHTFAALTEGAKAIANPAISQIPILEVSTKV